MKKLLGCLLLVMHAVVTAAASSTSVVERVRVDSSDGEQVIEISPISSPAVPSLVLKSSGGSRTRGSRVNLAAFCADLDRVGITPNDIEGAKERITQQLKTTTPRSERTMETLLKKFGDAVEHQKAALSESTGVRSALSTTSPSAPNSDEDISTPLGQDSSDSDDEVLQKMLIQLHLANGILTHNAVVAQDSLEQAEIEAETNKKQYRVGLVVGIVGTALAVIFGGVAFIPPFVA